MAQFKEVTRPGAGKITISLDNICTIERVDKVTTTIRFLGEQFVHVEETPEQIIGQRA